jgi:hypothetical protein
MRPLQLLYGASSYCCIWGLKLLLNEAFTTTVWGLKLLLYKALSLKEEDEKLGNLRNENSKLRGAEGLWLATFSKIARKVACGT